MILLDTHAWIWWASGSSRLSVKASKAVRTADQIGVSPLSCWEVAMLTAKGRLVLDRDVDLWVDQALRLPRVELLNLTPAIAVKSTRLREGFHGDPVDRFLAATALEHGCPLVSKDDRIRSYPGLKVIW